MSEFVSGTAAGLVDNEWEDLDEQEESGAVEGFEEWGVPLPTNAAENSGKLEQKPVPGAAKGRSASQELGDTDASAADYHEGGKNAAGGDNWGSWGAAWTAFTSAVQQV